MNPGDRVTFEYYRKNPSGKGWLLIKGEGVFLGQNHKYAFVRNQNVVYWVDL